MAILLRCQPCRRGFVRGFTVRTIGREDRDSDEEKKLVDDHCLEGRNYPCGTACQQPHWHFSTDRELGISLHDIAFKTFLFSLGVAIKFDTRPLSGTYFPYQETVIDCVRHPDPRPGKIIGRIMNTTLQINGDDIWRMEEAGGLKKGRNSSFDWILRYIRRGSSITLWRISSRIFRDLTRSGGILELHMKGRGKVERSNIKCPRRRLRRCQLVLVSMRGPGSSKSWRRGAGYIWATTPKDPSAARIQAQQGKGRANTTNPDGDIGMRGWPRRRGQIRNKLMSMCWKREHCRYILQNTANLRAADPSRKQMQARRRHKPAYRAAITDIVEELHGENITRRNQHAYAVIDNELLNVSALPLDESEWWVILDDATAVIAAQMESNAPLNMEQMLLRGEDNRILQFRFCEEDRRR
ncbi:uncharacterized protein EV420DRAFT_1751779 [Desarmillaria tabescens]|uniref:Uncharacterized protein n=1 Tax=Armillaria tabescens TaxID=1929756 RepID=A0AA39JKX4_ARMTA|nr:uncharacterized protein EV420DRAFT_1751779 [Desarmillaria tabescens]KAK0444637.1 hypothetical protein EV420DRAFT_1751779 [Desarmillaria tabescens]